LVAFCTPEVHFATIFPPGLLAREVALDCSQHKAPMGGEGTGPNPGRPVEPVSAYRRAL